MVQRRPKVLVLGDLIIDEYIYGAVHRISPEAPVPVVVYGKSVVVKGGAGNVVANLQALGAETKFWYDGKSCHKTRIVAGHQQLVRLDKDDVTEVSPPTNLAAMVEWADVVLISDYNKGVVTRALLQQLEKVLRVCRKPLLVDPYNGKCWYGNRVSLIKPNRSEAESITDKKISDINSLLAVGQCYLNKTDAESCIITLGADGMAFFDRHAYWDEPLVVPSEAQQVFDVTGAGDTVIAVLAYLWPQRPRHLPIKDILKLANRAAGLVCSKLGTAVVGKEELFENTPTLQEN